MRIELTPQEEALLEAEKIPFRQNGDYTEDEALELLERVREAEVAYSQGTDEATERRYRQYSELGNRLFEMIPE